MLRLPWPVLARPTYSSISLGGWPAAATRLGSRISSGMIASIPQHRQVDRPGVAVDPETGQLPVRVWNGVIEHMTGFFPTGRDRGVTVAVEGFFAFVWFGWGQASAPSWLVVPLAVGTGLAVLLTVAGVVVTKRSAGRLRVMADPEARRRYSIIVGLEFGLLGA